MTDRIKIHKTDGRWSVRAAGAVICETSNALELVEDGYPPVIYFPRSDIAMALLDRSDKTSTCPFKGEASYYSIETKNGPIADVAWSYETPISGMEDIAGHIAFYPHEKLAIEQV